ncbi:hypothetical protein ACWEVD_20570 [Nocardia thailandica]|uniref:Uncharacterized protein n=1 Tax=Nocardia thailandica TaxID=257275 RepID=A0ABW6PGK5_9NOCA
MSGTARSAPENRHLVAKGLTATGAAALFIVLRVFAITDYHWGAAFSVVSTLELDDVPPMILGTLMASPFLGGIAVSVLLAEALIRQIRLGMPRWESAGNTVWLILLCLFAASLTWTYRIWWVPGTAAALAALLLAVLWTSKRTTDGARFARWFMTRTGIVIAAAALGLAAAVQVPWMTKEDIDTRTGRVEGWVLENPPGFLKVLLERDREIRIIDVNDVLHREEIDPEP